MNLTIYVVVLHGSYPEDGVKVLEANTSEEKANEIGETGVEESYFTDFSVFELTATIEKEKVNNDD